MEDSIIAVPDGTKALMDGLQNPTAGGCTNAACDGVLVWLDGRGDFAFAPWMVGVQSAANGVCVVFRYGYQVLLYKRPHIPL